MSAKIEGKFMPPQGKTLVFVGGSWKDEFIKYRETTGNNPSGLKYYWGFVEDVSYFWHHSNINMKGEGAVMVSFALAYPHKPDAKHAIRDILDGKLDGNIDKIGKAFKDSKRPIFAIIGTEFDYVKSYKPAEYAECFRYIHDRWDNAGVNNVAYIWHSCCEVPPNVWDYYPGDKYVDWFGISFYNQYNLPGAAKLAQMAKDHGKPLAVCESTPYGGTAGKGGKQTWNSWFEPFFAKTRQMGVRAIVYNNMDSAQGAEWGEGRMHLLEPEIRRSWSAEMRKIQYLKSSPELYKTIGFKAED